MSHRHLSLTLAVLAGTLASSACHDVALPTAPEALGPQGIAAPEAANLDRARSRRGPIVIEFVVGVNVMDRYEFRAYKDEDGKVSGRFRLQEVRFDANDPRGSRVTVKARGRVVCLEAVGNKARLGGIVKKSNFKSILPVGSALVWSVTDNGTGGWSLNDTASPFFGGIDPFLYCAAGLAYPEKPVRSGDVEVEDDDLDDTDSTDDR